jgi:hypothetical protein
MLPTYTVWLHRANACDLLVRLDSKSDAYIFAVNFLNTYNGHVIQWDLQEFSDPGNCFQAGYTASTQVSIHPGLFHHYGWSNGTYSGPWNTEGTALVSANEAHELGEDMNPDGFIAGEAEYSVWERNTQGEAELNEQLDDYNRLGQIENQTYIRNLINGMPNEVYNQFINAANVINQMNNLEYVNFMNTIRQRI